MTNADPGPFGALLLRLRAVAGLTQEQLAARAGLSPKAVAALERGTRRTPRAVTVELLANALNLDADAHAHLVAVARAVGATEQDAARGNGDAARHLPWRTRRLAAEPTPLVDRASELDTIVRALAGEGTRLLTLTGPAGVGKTRLALAAAAQLAEPSPPSPESPTRFPDGVVVVDLAPVREPPLVLATLARALELSDTGQPSLGERLAAFLRGRTLLVVLDNVEQVLPTAAGLLANLLASCLGLALLVTSRVPLQLRWEQTLRVAPLAVPDLRTALPPPDTLGQIPAVELFVARARARRADFVLGAKQVPLVAQLVEQLDGLPLALELAAARLDVLPLATLARRLGDRLRLLASEAPDLPARQQSLAAAVGWSYDLLSEPERRFFRCLGVFVGRVALDAIAAVAEEASAQGTRDERRPLGRLAALAEKSLVLPGQAEEEGSDGEEEEDPEPAFGMLETVREYAQEQLAAHGELAVARRAHARYFLALAEHADPLLRGQGQRAWYLRLGREQDNLRAALRWLLDQEAPAERAAALRLAGALGYFWWARGYHAEGVRWLEEALARAPQEGAEEAARTRALLGAGLLLAYQGDLARAQAVLEEALALARRRQDAADTAAAISYLGTCALFAGELVAASLRHREALRRGQVLGDPHRIGVALYGLGLAAFAHGNDVEAAALEADALERFEMVGDARLASSVRFNLALIVWQHGDLPRAVALVRAGLRVSATLRDRYLLATGAREAVELLEEPGTGADLAGRARLLGAADALAQATGTGLGLGERVAAARGMARLREQLAREEGAGGAAYRAGRALPFDAVATLALRLLEGGPDPFRWPSRLCCPWPPDAPPDRGDKPAERARAGGAGAGGPGPLQQGHRAPALHRGQHCHLPPDLGLSQAGGRHPRAGGGSGGAARLLVNRAAPCPKRVLSGTRQPCAHALRGVDARSVLRAELLDGLLAHDDFLTSLPDADLVKIPPRLRRAPARPALLRCPNG